MTDVDAEIAQVFRTEWVRVVATLRRDLGDLDAAEDAAQDAFAEAVRVWPGQGIPDRPGGWLTTTARRRALDRLRRDRRFADRMPQLVGPALWEDPDPARLVDDQLALVFGCCHRALSTDAQVALTLRAVAGLTTAQIAHAFLLPEATMAARLTRAKRKIATAGVPFAVPGQDELSSGLGSVLSVVYLVYTEGHTSAVGEALVRGDLCDEAIWLADTMVDLLPKEPEVLGLAALLHLTDVRRAARLDDRGMPVLIEHQDRSQWDPARRDVGLRLLARAGIGEPGRYVVQAKIAALHAQAARWEDTDWAGIVRCYDDLLRVHPTPVVALNRAVAVAMRDGPATGLAELDQLATDPVLSRYHYLHAARADLLRRLGRSSEAVTAYRRAIRYCTNDAERSFLSGRLDSLTRPQ